MRQVAEAYAGLWLVMFLILFSIAFTIINLNVSQARKILDDIKAEIQASNGEVYDTYIDNPSLVNGDTVKISGKSLILSTSSNSMADYGYSFQCTITPQNFLTSSDAIDGETFIYNDIYLVHLDYSYFVPLFGKQLYPIETYAY